MNIMSLFSSGVLRALGVALITFAALCLHVIYGKDATPFVASATQLLDGALALGVAVALFWAAIARVKLPNPPLSQSAAAAHVDILAKQGAPVVQAVEQRMVEIAKETPAAAASSSSSSSVKLALLFLVLVPIAAAALHGCAALAPQSIDSKLYAANQVVTSVELGTDQALNAGLITAAQARSVSTIAHQVNPLIDSVRAAEAANNPTAANQTLNLINSLLAGLQAYVPAPAPGSIPAGMQQPPNRYIGMPATSSAP